MESRRVIRVEREIQHVIAELFIHGLKMPLPGLATVLEVKATADLRRARVFVKINGSKADQEKASTLLKEQHGEIQREVAGQLKMKFCPVLQFVVGGQADSDQIEEIDILLANLNRRK